MIRPIRGVWTSSGRLQTICSVFKWADGSSLQLLWKRTSIKRSVHFSTFDPRAMKLHNADWSSTYNSSCTYIFQSPFPQIMQKCLSLSRRTWADFICCTSKDVHPPPISLWSFLLLRQKKFSESSFLLLEQLLPHSKCSTKTPHCFLKIRLKRHWRWLDSWGLFLHSQCPCDSAHIACTYSYNHTAWVES